ncbi:MAG: DUF2490 domain-containing protein, partial [Crocinitomicaceae bacterium]|nr:DUF2490 domain-containing protein [Crocinitomicaceae bacterium]
SFSQKQISTQQHAWVMYTGNHKLTERWGIHTEYQWRRSDYFQDWQQSLLRLGLDYYSKQNALYTLGYGWIRSYQYGEQPIAHANNEHRIWEQFILKNKVGRVEFQHRYRLEQRIIENWKVNSTGEFEQDGFIFRQRVRYRFLATVPLSRKEMLDNTLFLAVYDEPFLGFGKGIAKNILDQNRLYFALGWRFNKNCNVQLGYLNQYIVKTDGIKAERNHTLQIGLTYNLDFSKQ